ncbi:MAG: hypothetical protein PHG12_09810, partial [Sphaerochaeta sp.]|nr:hypothetical protein [Sphaerochaeta sp.]
GETDVPSEVTEDDGTIPVSCTVSDDDGDNGKPVPCELDETEPADGPGGRYTPVEPEAESAADETEPETPAADESPVGNTEPGTEPEPKE